MVTIAYLANSIFMGLVFPFDSSKRNSSESSGSESSTDNGPLRLDTKENCQLPCNFNEGRRYAEAVLVRLFGSRAFTAPPTPPTHHHHFSLSPSKLATPSSCNDDSSNLISVSSTPLHIYISRSCVKLTQLNEDFLRTSR